MSCFPYIMNTPSHTQKQYYIRTALFMGGYVALNLTALSGAFDDLRSPGTWGMALIAAAPVIGQIWALLSYMHHSDEFVRGLLAKRFIVAGGIAMALFSAWGFMESYAHTPHVPGWLIFPLFCAAFGAVTPFIQTSR
jgi:putative oxidoreductase